MARTDDHRPSAQGFDPQNYDYLIATDLNGDGLGGAAERRARMEMVNRMIAQGFRFDEQYSHGQCTHCGAHIRYEALMAYLPERTLISVGEQCLGNRFETSAADFQALRTAAAAQAKATREAHARNETTAKVLAWLADDADPLLVELSYQGNGGTVDGSEFLSDIARKLFLYGDLSPRQGQYAAVAIERDMVRQGRADQRAKDDAARLATAQPAPVGKVTVTGQIESTWTVESFDGYGVTPKMAVRHTDGWIVKVTIPAPIMREVDGDRTALHGRKIEFVATLGLATWKPEPDVTVAYGKRPSKVRLIG